MGHLSAHINGEWSLRIQPPYIQPYEFTIIEGLPFLTTGKTIIDAPDGFCHLKGKRISTAKKYLSHEVK